MTLKAAVQSMRLRMLPLSMAGVLLGILLATADWRVDLWTAVLIVLTAVCLHILSNLSNGQGEGQKKGLIAVFVVLSVVSGTLMTWRAFGTLWDLTPILVLMLGGAAIMAAMKFTPGRNPNGYRGLFYVFLFFGLVSVLGACFVCTVGAGLHWKLLLPASATGFFSMGVLNVNSLRDMHADEPDPVTVAVRPGEKRAMVYQTVLIVLGWACMAAYCLLCWPSIWHWLWVLTLPLYVLHLRGVWTRSGKALDPMLPLLVMGTFFLNLLAGIGFCAHLL